jgi:hypothetical protein
MLWSGEYVRRRGSEAASSEAESRSRGASCPRARRRFTRGRVGPSSEAEIRSRGHQALERGGVLAAWRPILERDGDSPEGYRGRSFGGSLRLSGPWALLLWAVTTRSVFWGLWVVSLRFIIFFEKGIFPGY